MTFLEKLLFPPHCVLCGASGHWPGKLLDLCPPCRADLPTLGVACQRCGEVITTAGVCGSCLHQPPPQRFLVAPFRYQFPVDHLITGLKFHNRLHFAPLLGILLADHLRENYLLPGTIQLPEQLLPVPLHSSRLRQRGYNQALELARALGKSLGIPLETRLCQRTRATAAQSGLDAYARIANVRGAFAVTGTPRAKRIAIVDDVVTTGHTVAALAQALLDAGVGEVQVWAVARA